MNIRRTTGMKEKELLQNVTTMQSRLRKKMVRNFKGLKRPNRGLQSFAIKVEIEWSFFLILEILIFSPISI